MDIDYPDDGEDDTAKAYASIAAQLEQFTSPHLAAPQDTSYQMDAMDWLKQELKEEAPTAPVEADLKTPVKKKRTSLLERADTPVMSNSSSKKKEKRADDDDEVMAPVQTPFKNIFSPAATTPSSHKTLVVVGNTSTQPSQYHIYRRYHDALYSFLL